MVTDCWRMSGGKEQVNNRFHIHIREIVKLALDPSHVTSSHWT
jgi:hypothetical protein